MYPPTILSIGMKIKKWRTFKDYKQEVLAKEIGISRIMLSRYENGRSKISILQLQKIASLLEVELSVFLGNVQNE
jgi:transcriptional regulator with XRE-family HTH domain